MISRRIAPLLVAFAAATALGGAPATARADGPTAADLKKARAQFQRGIELEQASNWSEAIQQFRDVGAVRMTPQVRFHIAYCEEGLGRLVTALGGYELAQNEADQVGSDFKHEVENAISELRARIPKLFIDRGKNADAALVQLDGVDLGASSVGVEVPLDPGPHTVTATAPGYLQFTATPDLKEKEVTHVTLDLEPEPEPVAPPPPPEKKIIVIEEQQTPNRTIPYVVGGAGIGALAGAGVLFALRQATNAQLQKDCPNKDACPESNRGTYNRLKAYDVATPIVAGVGVAAVGAAAALILFEKKPPPKETEEKESLRLLPSAPGAFAGVSLDGRF
ncbi:MAG TPA: PEGA domain-containing protein [Polyangiaceae bacterium]|nr:PEGA domain-containing protein [Polyangiaceae bacterium]